MAIFSFESISYKKNLQNEDVLHEACYVISRFTQHALRFTYHVFSNDVVSPGSTARVFQCHRNEIVAGQLARRRRCPSIAACCNVCLIALPSGCVGSACILMELICGFQQKHVAFTPTFGRWSYLNAMHFIISETRLFTDSYMLSPFVLGFT